PARRPHDPLSPSFPVAVAAPQLRDRQMPRLLISTAPDSLPPPKDNHPQTSGPSPACPQCVSPMAWVEEPLRFYCKSCRMYCCSARPPRYTHRRNHVPSTCCAEHSSGSRTGANWDMVEAEDTLGRPR